MGAHFPPPLLPRQLGRLAPRRVKLTKTFAPSPLPQPTLFNGSTPQSTLCVIPIEAPCYAVRLGFGNPYDYDMTISSASVWPSDSYGGADTAQVAVNNSVAPTGGAAGAKIYFDSAGADVGTINTSGTQRSLTLSAVTTNTSNAQGPFAIKWSDWVPCTSIPRADGSLRHILFVVVTWGSAGVPQLIAYWNAMNADASVSARGRQIYYLNAWSHQTDYSDNPSGTGWSTIFGSNPQGIGPFCIQYLTANPGIQIVTVGDSLSTAPHSDNISTPVWRAAMDLSSPGMPIEVANFAWGGQGSAVYDVLLADNAAAVNPSVVAFQPLSRNDGMTSAILQGLLAKAAVRADSYGNAFGARIIWNTPGCDPSADGNQTSIDAFNDMRGRLIASAADSGIPLIDGPAAVGNVAGGAPWDYLVGMSDDNVHPNSAGAEVITPLATAALRETIG